jgi:hypothetical protein
LARTQNIGAEEGSWVPNAEWHQQNQFNKNWAGGIETLSPRDVFIDAESPEPIMSDGVRKQ